MDYGASKMQENLSATLGGAYSTTQTNNWGMGSLPLPKNPILLLAFQALGRAADHPPQVHFSQFKSSTKRMI